MDILTIIADIVEASQNIWGALSVGWNWFWVSAWPWIWEWVIIGIVYKALVAHYIGGWIVKWSKKKLLSTKEQVALWFHYRDRAMGKGHEEDPEVCLEEGLCYEVNSKKLGI